LDRIAVIKYLRFQSLCPRDPNRTDNTKKLLSVEKEMNSGQGFLYFWIRRKLTVFKCDTTDQNKIVNNGTEILKIKKKLLDKTLHKIVLLW